MHPLRTRFKKEIVAEFLPPFRRTQGKPLMSRRPTRNRVIIFCPGLHGGPSKSGLLEFWAKKGYWTFAFRYRGTWESGGRFLQYSHENDVLDIVSQLSRGFVSIPERKCYVVRPDSTFVFGVSFGGAAALLAGGDPRITKVVAFSPVVDWRDHVQRGHTLDWSRRFTREGFGDAYRFSDRDWAKLKTGTFFNPVTRIHALDGKKMLIIHAQDDKIVRIQPTARFAKKTGATLVMLRRGGHGSSSWFTKPQLSKRIVKFLRNTS